MSDPKLEEIRKRVDAGKPLLHYQPRYLLTKLDEARTVVRLRKLADHCSESSEPERAGGYRAASWIVTNDLLGSNGCVIAAFDERLPKILDALAATPTEEN